MCTSAVEQHEFSWETRVLVSCYNGRASNCNTYVIELAELSFATSGTITIPWKVRCLYRLTRRAHLFHQTIVFDRTSKVKVNRSNFDSRQRFANSWLVQSKNKIKIKCRLIVHKVLLSDILFWFICTYEPSVILSYHQKIANTTESLENNHQKSYKRGRDGSCIL